MRNDNNGAAQLDPLREGGGIGEDNKGIVEGRPDAGEEVVWGDYGHERPFMNC